MGGIMRFVRLLLFSLALSAVLLTAHGRDAQPALAQHHAAQISEVMFGFGPDREVQFVEIELLSAGQQVIANTRLTFFSADGSFETVLLDPLGSNVMNSPGKVLMATQAFVDLTGVTPDVTFPPDPFFPPEPIVPPDPDFFPPNPHMVCWGAPGIFAPVDFDTTDPNNYVDCVSFGGAAFTGNNPMMSNPGSAVPGSGDGRLSLTRIMDSTGKASNPWRNSDNGTFYELQDPSPENNAGVIGTLVLPVGGIAELPDVASTPLEAEGSSGPGAGLVAGIAAAVAAGALALGGAAWYAGRRIGS